jgi:serine/threonine protein kinase
VALRRRAARGHELFPEFTDVQEIGVGSLATVYRAREITANRLVALKLLNIRDASSRSIESFERESIALGALSAHPNIVTLYRVFRVPDGRPVLVLELCSGAVSDRLRDGAGLPVAEAVAIGIKIADALETAHRNGVLHRDVKPQNFLVTEFGEPALADFGVARLQSSTQTTAGLFDFTTLHAAPELLEGGGTAAATDVYELASSLYQLIAGRAAFRAYDGESPASVILRILRDPVRPLSGVEVPVALSDLLVRGMSKQMDDRPHSAAEFAAELATIEIGPGRPRSQFPVADAGPPIAMAVSRFPDAAPTPPAPPAEWTAPTLPPRHRSVPPGGRVPPPIVAAPPPAAGPDPGSVPVWAVRASGAEQAGFVGPQFRTDVSLDPAALRRRVALRAGASSVIADQRRLRLRTWFTRSEIPWSDILAFETHPDGPVARGGTGHLVALTSGGPVALPGTRRPLPELRLVHARLDAYRIRAGHRADR